MVRIFLQLKIAIRLFHVYTDNMRSLIIVFALLLASATPSAAEESRSVERSQGDATQNLSVPEPTPRPQSSYPDEDLVLIELWFDNLFLCRMGEDDDGIILTEEKRDEACDRRDAVGTVLFNKNYCFDRFEYAWNKCVDLPYADIQKHKAWRSEYPRWWHGTFVPAGDTQGACDANDSSITYDGANATDPDLGCIIINSRDLVDIHAVVLDMRCSRDGEYMNRTEVLMSRAVKPTEMNRAGIVRYPGMATLSRCVGNRPRP